MKTTSTHKCARTGETWSINAPITCLTTNVIYKITCRKCEFMVYIGETKRALYKRIAEHRHSITQKTKKKRTAIGRHFNKPGHSVADLVVEAIERVLPMKNDALRKVRESYWINVYDAARYGSNVRN